MWHYELLSVDPVWPPSVQGGPVHGPGCRGHCPALHQLQCLRAVQLFGGRDRPHSRLGSAARRQWVSCRHSRYRFVDRDTTNKCSTQHVRTWLLGFLVFRDHTMLFSSDISPCWFQGSPQAPDAVMHSPSVVDPLSPSQRSSYRRFCRRVKYPSLTAATVLVDSPVLSRRLRFLTRCSAPVRNLRASTHARWEVAKYSPPASACHHLHMFLSLLVLLKGLSGFFFPKYWSYSVERVDEGGWPQQSKVFFLKIALLANVSPSKLIRLPAGTSASKLQVLFQISLYPHWLNIGWRLFNDWLRISQYQISAHFTR